MVQRKGTRRVAKPNFQEWDKVTGSRGRATG